MVAVKLGAEEPEPVKATVAVAADAVIVALAPPLSVNDGGVGVPEVTTDKVNVTPAGIPEKVKRMFEPLDTADPLLELCVAVRQAEAKPSVRMNDPVASGTERFVKIVALDKLMFPPVAPMSIAPMPAPKALITVRGPGVVKM